MHISMCICVCVQVCQTEQKDINKEENKREQDNAKYPSTKKKKILFHLRLFIYLIRVCIMERQYDSAMHYLMHYCAILKYTTTTMNALWESSFITSE